VSRYLRSDRRGARLGHIAEATGGFVLNVVSEDLASIVHKTAEFYPPEVSETDTLGIELAPSRRVAAPRIAAAPVNLECKLLQILEFGEERDQNLVGEVVYFHVRDSIYATARSTRRGSGRSRGWAARPMPDWANSSRCRHRQAPNSGVSPGPWLHSLEVFYRELHKIS
jgi:flavin reductase (DIM6/NTAB) family NADH-FMN oxidoreductase RutF